MKKFNPEIWLTDRRNFNVADWLNPEISRKSSRKSDRIQAEFHDLQKIAYDVDIVISRIEEQKIDLTGNRAEWVKLAFIFSASFAESGRNFFHRVSRFYSGYCPAECDDLYDDCMKRKKFENIRAFFLMARNAGVNIRVL